MKIMKTAKQMMIALTGMAMMTAALAAPATVKDSDLLLQGDALSRHESSFLQSVYAAGNRHFQRGEFLAALKQYDYAAWHGSVAAAQRLCIMDAYGIGTEPNALKASFWCEKAVAGGNDLADVRAYLENYWVATK